MRHDPLELPLEVEFSTKTRILFALGAWFLLFLPAIAIALLVLIVLSLR